MATSIYSVPSVQTTDAEFRAWGKALSDALQAVGLVKTGDTGQINWTTVLKPGAINTSQGYEVYRFADALQASAPCVFKIEYGSGSAATTPAIWITVGKTTDNAGTLTGLFTTRKQLTSASNASAQPCRVSGDTNRIVAVMNTNLANGPFGFGIERTHDGAGADTAEGLLFWTLTAANTGSQRYFSMSGGEGAVEGNFGALCPAAGGGSTGAAVALYPVFLTKGIFCNPLRDMLIAFAATVTAGVQISLTHYNAVRLFMPLSTPSPSTGRVSASLAMLIRDE